jgi:peptide/nickel transport system permease protein
MSTEMVPPPAGGTQLSVPRGQAGRTQKWLYGQWPNFLARRVVRLAISLLVLITATFLMVHLIPGDPVQTALGDQATPALVALRRHALGLDRPLWSQYLHYLGEVMTGNLGNSIATDSSVAQILSERFPNTLRLAVPAFLLVILLSLPIGLFAAVRTRGGRGRTTRALFVNVTGLLNSIPDYVLATVLSVLFVVTVKIFPASGDVGASSYVLPVIALVVGPAASLSRIVRVEALKVLDTEYVRAAKSRRLPAALRYRRHVLPNMMTASLTFGTLILSGLIAGTVLVENVFAWPGVGTVIAQAVVQKDFPLVQGVLLVLGATVLVLNTVVDVVLGVLDPRSRVGEM